jgi:hypothetical protein
MKLTLNKEKGSAFVLVFLVIVVTSVWISSLALFTKFGADMEGRRITMNETLASADASLERCWSRWRDLSANGSTLPTTTQMNDGWLADNKVYASLNTGVYVDANNVTLKQIDSLGRELLPDLHANVTAKTDVSRGLIKRSTSYLASVIAQGIGPIGATNNEVRIRVNRVYEKSDIPLFQYLAFFDHTLHIHPGPKMKINGRLHSNFRVVSTPGNDGAVNIFANISGPKNSIDKSALSNSAINAAILSEMSGGREQQIEGFYEDTQVPYSWNDLGESTHKRKDDMTTLQGGAAYQESGKLNLFDPNDKDYQYWWGKESPTDTKKRWETATNENIKGGFRELIEKPVTTDGINTFATGQEDTLFIAMKRFYNQADLKIEIRTTLTQAEINAGETVMKTIDGVKMLNPKLADIWYKSGPDRIDVPDANDPDYPAKKKKAIEDVMAKTKVDDTLKKQILATFDYSQSKFYDIWADLDSSTNDVDGFMDVTDIDMKKLKKVLDDWTGADGSSAGTGAPLPKEGIILYIGDSSSGPTTAAGREKGLRIINGQQLPYGGLTMATDMMTYIRGDYNTGNTDFGNSGTKKVDTNNTDSSFNDFSQKNYAINFKDYTNSTDNYLPENYPSAIIADFIKLQSNAWTDSGNAAASNTRPAAAATTYNFAMVMGDKPKSIKEFDTGGLHNFPKFMENWENKESTIIGSFIQLWTSKYNNMGHGGDEKFYKPPLRNWGFAGNYLFRTPPGSLDAIEYTRGRYWFSVANQ